MNQPMQQNMPLRTPESRESYIPISDPNLAGTIDYATHPAYGALTTSASMAARTGAIARFLRFFFVVVFKRLVGYEVLPLALRKPRSPADFLRLAVRIVRYHWIHVARRRNRHFRDNGNAMTRSLAQDGVLVFALPAPLVERIEAASAPLFRELVLRRGERSEGREFLESRTQARRDAHSELFAAIESALAESGLLAAVQNYVGCVVKLVDVNPQINDPSDNFWMRVFPDEPVPLPPGAYLHKDSSGGDIKVMIYLSDVDRDSGAFSFIVGSHRSRARALDDWIAETNDHAGLSGTEPEVRRQFAALPRRLRQKGSFGNDLKDLDQLRGLLASEWVISGVKGCVVAFDTKGFHRGGMVRHGERRVITCVIG